MVLFTNVNEKDLKKLKGFSIEEVKTIYEIARLKKNGVSIVLYDSGKLLLQGKDVEKVSAMIRKAGIGNEQSGDVFRKETGWIIGSDETLKGDTFGGIVVAAVKADKKLREELRLLGVADSKKLADKEIVLMAEKIKKIVPCEIKSLLPEEYNEFEGNVTKMLDKLHQQAAHDLHPGKHVVDKYPGCGVGEIAVEKAESKYVEVAAASVLARAVGLQQLEYLSLQAGFNVPKGSTHVKLALHELLERRLNFKKFVKMNFKNVSEFLEKSRRS